ncbi:MAG: hypothetical protein AAFU34_15640 [Pseudomonadota bacterium]
MHVKINTAALTDHEVAINDSAARTVRMGFNPSEMPRIDEVKALAAALISACEDIRDDSNMGGVSGGREAALAITHVQTASMFAVAAATAHLSG